MTHEEQVGQFANELASLVGRSIEEYDLPAASIVGVLHMQAHHTSQDAREQYEDQEESE